MYNSVFPDVALTQALSHLTILSGMSPVDNTTSLLDLFETTVEVDGRK
jgi:hypothetical protein